MPKLFLLLKENLPEFLKVCNNLNNPIEVVIHLKSDKVRYGSMGIPYIEKRYSVTKGSQRVIAAKELGYTHIEGILVNDGL